MLSEEGVEGTGQKKIFIGNVGAIDRNSFFEQLTLLKVLAYSNEPDKVIDVIKQMVPNFTHETWHQVSEDSV